MNEARRQRYALAKPIAFAAMELGDAAQRERYVEAACQGDEALRDEVLWMLEAADDTSEAPLLLPLMGDLHDASGSSVDGAEACRYRLVRQLGEGGMGVVYLAERIIDEGSPEEIRQRVALKFINTGSLLAPGVRRRFAEERRILGSLSHPGIAHLIDGGSTRDGRPFLALEFVEGERIDAWCERHQLSLRRRVVLFLKVCAAVRHAHERLVIHRDIKPANILVTADGEPKLLDFGIARLLDHVGGVAAAQTMTMQRALTLAYASPEQVRGEPLGTRADVWSLGVVLYQLVCGQRPFGSAHGDSPLDISNAIVTGRMLPPSRRVRRETVGKVMATREVPPDVDAIVMKALRRNPSERYATVGEMATDLENFLDLRPVRARRGHRWYRLGLYLRRHRVGLGVAGVMLAMLLGFGVEREAQLRRVELERDKTQAIAGFMQELFENADPTHAGGSHVTVRQVLDRGAVSLARRTDIAPQVRVSLMVSMARSYNQLSLGGPAVALMKQALELQQAYQPATLERGEVYAALGRGYSTMLDESSAIVANERAIALLSEAPGDHADAVLRVRINQLYNHLGVQDLPLAEVRSQIDAIVAALEQRPDRHEPELHIQALAVLALTQAAQGEDGAAIAVAQRAVREADRLFVADDTNHVYYRFVEALVSLRTRPEQALDGFRRALADYDTLIGTSSPSLAALLGYFGGALAQTGRTGDAVRALERASQIAGNYAADSPDFYFSTLDALAAQYLELQRHADAESLLLPHLDGMRRRVAAGSAWARTNLADAFNVTAAVALRRRQGARALEQFRRARDLLGEREQKTAPETYATALAGMGSAALAVGDPRQAASWLDALRGFNDRAGLALPQPAALDAQLLAVSLNLARGEFQQAASLAATAAAQSDTRWGACSRRSQALRQLQAEARHGMGAAPAGVFCAVDRRVAAP
ncbi:serine/threonine-protein kinase [Dyella sp.]|jgi:serine/threonine-protein kinase|uniref:serine/threonine-protein kinase n=1 Tax=Dyella sp. TaxID=1869338 RepID=UPI002D78B194|nr:serine/threonine-protein kinase [Dyella sp.]HET6432043.1 serine/threonine-protein kinase [Dyella sp.]